MQNFSCLGWLKLLNYTFPGGRPAKPEINANLSPAWSAGAWAELGKSRKIANHGNSGRLAGPLFLYFWASWVVLRLHAKFQLPRLAETTQLYFSGWPAGRLAGQT